MAHNIPNKISVRLTQDQKTIMENARSSIHQRYPDLGLPTIGAVLDCALLCLHERAKLGLPLPKPIGDRRRV